MPHTRYGHIHESMKSEVFKLWSLNLFTKICIVNMCFSMIKASVLSLASPITTSFCFIPQSSLAGAMNQFVSRFLGYYQFKV